MSWSATFGVAVVAGLGGTLAAGYTANLAVSWYRISSFEGQSGYFVVLLGLVGLVLGIVVGVIVARAASGSFLHAVATSLGVVAGLTLLGAGSARLLADVPPAIDGDTLLLAVEYRWPESQVDAPAAGTDDPVVRLASISGSAERSAAVGPLWLQDSRREDGHWVSPGAVQLFTERSRRVLTFVADGAIQHGVVVPLPRRPGASHLQWSEWLPADADGAAHGAHYRVRVHRSSAPIRVEQFGPFEVAMNAASFWLATDLAGRQRIDGEAWFTIRHRGEPVFVERQGMYGSTASPRLERASAVAALDGQQPALLACMARYDRPCFLLVSDHDSLRTEFVAELTSTVAGHELTSDPARYELSSKRTWPRSGVQRALFERGVVYQLGPVLLDTNVPRVLQAEDSLN